VVFSIISKTLFSLCKGKWVEELPRVVWSHNRMTSRAMGFTPFKMLYREEAMLPEEAKHQSLRVLKHALVSDEEYSKETIEGTRLEAMQNINKYQEQTKNWRDSQVVRKEIHHKDLVLRRRPNAANVGKLQPKWEGPYTAKATGRPGSFYLTDTEGKTSTHTWNIDNL
jgi:hypothetical protein